MAHCHHLLNFKFEVKVVKLENFNLDLQGSIFIRYYVSAGRRRRICIDTREIPSTSNPCWNELALVECRGPSDSIGELRGQQSLVFELRWSRTASVFRRVAGSKLLGKAEVTRKDAIGSTGMFKKRFGLCTSQSIKGLPPPTLLVEMKLQVADAISKRISWSKCNCSECEWIGSEEDMFQAATIIDGR
ncbi:uncharacterized protein [Typha latifolia]|uniref:uncharacterized protein n=1 Tax=Typha latifolia TaxID=4733 RepID=UPI003C2B8513